MLTTIKPAEFRTLANYVRAVSGIALDDDKTYLLESRLAGLLKTTSTQSYGEFYNRLVSDATGGLKRQVIDAVTTNETFFFRDAAPFELLRHKVLPDLIDRKRRQAPGRVPVKIRIWSAACSTGQELYSIAIVIRELLGGDREFEVRLLGTDLSEEAVRKATAGCYNQVEIGRGLSPQQLQRYFSPVGREWQITAGLRGMAEFRVCNLMQDFSVLGRFDIILCRNVAIYFSPADKVALFNLNYAQGGRAERQSRSVKGCSVM